MILCFLSPPLQPRVIFSKSYFKWEPNFCKRTVTHRYSGNCSIVKILRFISIRSVMAVHFTVVLCTLSSKYNQRLYWLSIAMEQQPQDCGGHSKYLFSFVSVILLRVTWGSVGPLCFKQWIWLDLASHLIMAWAPLSSTRRPSGAQEELPGGSCYVCGRNASRRAQGHEDSAVPCLCWAE